MQRSSIGIGTWKLWAAAGLSAGLLELPFPLAGPMPPWRSLFAWIGLAPLIWALLSPPAAEGPRPLRRAFLLSYVCGVLWYAGNCYWVRDVMMQYGDMPPLAPSLLLLGFSLVLGTYFGLFGLGLALVRKATGSLRLTLLFAPVLWTALDLAASRITSVPWDQLGYSQVDNGILNQIAPWTGVYGITFVLVLLNALVAGVVLKMQGKSARDRIRGYLLGALALLLIAAGVSGVQVASPRAPTTATAVLIQPNLNVAGVGMWPGGEWTEHMGGFAKLAGEQCKTYIAGIPETGAPQGEIVCPPYATHPDLIAWPESPAPYYEADTRLQQALTGFARANQAAMVVGTIGSDYVPESGWKEYNSALVMGADGARVGRYDKIHLVPFGEYVPFSRLLFFAHKLTGKVSKFDRGEARETFRLNGHRYGVFICYEAVFADEVRQFARMGAEVLVNISDDGWYGDTSAPWQHLNMARMRAIENRRWILRDTNNGVTAAIDPYGRVRQSIPRHVEDALPAEYGFRDDVTFYTEYGDVFAWVCALVSLGMAVWSGRRLLRQPVGLWKDRTDLADSESFIRNLRSENQPGRLKG